jgi:hypothetical protein
MIVSCLFMLYLLLYKFLKVPFGDQYFYCFCECMTLLCIVSVSMIMVKKKNLLTFLMFKPFFIGYGYYRKSFPKTLICVFMRGGHELGECQMIMNVPLIASFGCFNWRLMAWWRSWPMSSRPMLILQNKSLRNKVYSDTWVSVWVCLIKWQASGKSRGWNMCFFFFCVEKRW